MVPCFLGSYTKEAWIFQLMNSNLDDFVNKGGRLKTSKTMELWDPNPNCHYFHSFHWVFLTHPEISGVSSLGSEPETTGDDKTAHLIMVM